MVELFLEQARSEDRVIKNPLDDAKILENRAEILQALFALVRAWDKKGQPKPKITVQAFIGWSEIVGGILENAGFCSPCLQPVLQDSGDKDFQDMKKLVETMNPGHRFSFKELSGFAGDHGVFENLIPSEDEEQKIAAGKRKRFSDLLKKYNGRLFPEGQRFLIEGDSQKTRRYAVFVK